MVRDHYWKGLVSLRNELEEEIVRQDLRTFHLTMMNTGLDTDSIFVSSVAYTEKMIEFVFRDYINESQRVILNTDLYAESASLSNKLRSINYKYRARIDRIFDPSLKKLKKQLRSNILKGDNELFSHSQKL